MLRRQAARLSSGPLGFAVEMQQLLNLPNIQLLNFSYQALEYPSLLYQSLCCLNLEVADTFSILEAMAHNADRGPTVVVLYWPLISVSALVMATRFYVRRKIQANGADDWIMIGTWVGSKP